MSPRRWYNPNLPQTLAIAQFLLYIDAFFAFLNLLTVSSAGVERTLLSWVISLGAVGAYVYGAYGIANTKKLGYKVAVVASFVPLTGRLIDALLAGSVTSNLTYVLGLRPSMILSTLFEYALIALLLHPMSREHQRIWFD